MRSLSEEKIGAIEGFEQNSMTSSNQREKSTEEVRSWSSKGRKQRKSKTITRKKNFE